MKVRGQERRVGGYEYSYTYIFDIWGSSPSYVICLKLLLAGRKNATPSITTACWMLQCCSRRFKHTLIRRRSHITDDLVLDLRLRPVILEITK